MKLWLASVCVVALVGGCGKKKEEGGGGKPAASSGQSAGGCDRREKEGICGEYHGAAKADWVKQQCAAMNVPYVESCPKDGVVGRCTNEAGTNMETQNVFYGPKLTKETVTAMCPAPGKVSDL